MQETPRDNLDLEHERQLVVDEVYRALSENIEVDLESLIKQKVREYATEVDLNTIQTRKAIAVDLIERIIDSDPSVFSHVFITSRPVDSTNHQGSVYVVKDGRSVNLRPSDNNHTIFAKPGTYDCFFISQRTRILFDLYPMRNRSKQYFDLRVAYNNPDRNQRDKRILDWFVSLLEENDGSIETDMIGSIEPVVYPVLWLKNLIFSNNSYYLVISKIFFGELPLEESDLIILSKISQEILQKFPKSSDDLNIPVESQPVAGGYVLEFGPHDYTDGRVVSTADEKEGKMKINWDEVARQHISTQISQVIY